MDRILVGMLSIFIICCSDICFGSEKQAAAHRESEKSQDQYGQSKKAIKKIGQFEIGKKRFVVIENVTEREGNILSYNSFEIQDEAGLSYYKQELELVPESDTAIERIFKLEGKRGEGLIIFFDTSPTAPPAGSSFQIFRVGKSKIEPLSPPISVYGSIEQLPKGKSKEALRLFNGDLIKIKVWEELIGVVVPLL